MIRRANGSCSSKLEVGRALEKVVQKIGSAGDVCLAGFSGPAADGVGPGPWLYWSMTRRVGASLVALPKISRASALRQPRSILARTVFSADQRTLKPRARPRLCKYRSLLYFDTFLHDETALNLRTVATDMTSVVRDQKCQLSDIPFYTSIPLPCHD